MNENTSLDEVKSLTERIRDFISRADGTDLMTCYADIEQFTAITGSGDILDFGEFKSICEEHYRRLTGQQIDTEQETFREINSDLFITTWTGRVEAHFEDGHLLTMEPYTVTTLIEKIDDQWKVTYNHESGTLPK